MKYETAIEKARIEQLRQTLPKGWVIRRQTFDQSPFRVRKVVFVSFNIVSHICSGVSIWRSSANGNCAVIDIVLLVPERNSTA